MSSDDSTPELELTSPPSREEERKARQRIYSKAYYEKHKEEIRAKDRVKSKAYREKHREKIAASKKAWYEANRVHILAKFKATSESVPNFHRVRNLKHFYGITLEDVVSMIDAQGNRCLCCKTEFGLLKAHKPCVDHCHATGKVRGILCNLCNRLLGFAADNPEILRTCADYLDHHAAE